MLHRGEWLKEWEQHYRKPLRQLKERGLTDSLGVSLYSIKEFEEALNIPEISTIQMPYNLLDQRARVNGCFEKAKKAGKLLFLRSINLQGVLTLSSRDIPPQLGYGLPHFKKCEDLALRLAINKGELAFRFALENSPDAVLVFGVESLSQLLENVRMAQKDHLISTKYTDDFFQLEKDVPERLINPSLWEGRS